MTKFVKLSNGIDMPIIGLGTFKVRGVDVLRPTLETAIAAGYRSIDTASVYRNEADIGLLLKELLPRHELERREIFITSKLGPKDHGKGRCRDACLGSLEKLGLSDIDLYLIHWPGTQGHAPGDAGNPTRRLESWRDMEQLYKQGKCRAIGVSNYTERHLTELLDQCEIAPHVLQTEYHPHLVRPGLLSLCQQHNILLQAYSSLGTTVSPEQKNKLLHDETVLSVSKEVNRSPALVLLRWAVQQSIGVIPKSTNLEHIRSNLEVFDFKLTNGQMDKLTSLDQQHHYCWNSETVL
ncbi:glyoxal reductase-like [Mya arenaria]|uniref:glyoxal reductase-like n=1 Tax=Mya arenaria TaxID=6604 RepID=UPI0022E97C50|nr:glyoxal reductase-like [Mya arenaria]